MQYKINLSEEALVFLAEMVALQYAQLIKDQLVCGYGGPLVQQLDSDVERSLQESLREMLQEPLRSKSFRSLLVEHFQAHPADAIRDISWPWMSECLTWEKE